jgi:hypothetical protein
MRYPKPIVQSGHACYWNGEEIVVSDELTKPGDIYWLPTGWGPRRRAGLLMIGFVLGLGFPFLVAGVALLVTDSTLRIEVVQR